MNDVLAQPHAVGHAHLRARIGQHRRDAAVGVPAARATRQLADHDRRAVVLQDRREAGKTIIYLAERGQTAEVDGQSYLVLEKGSIQRQEPNSRGNPRMRGMPAITSDNLQSL